MLPTAQQKCPIESRKRQVNFWRSSHFVQQINVNTRNKHNTLKTQLRRLHGYGCVIMQLIVSSHANSVIESRFVIPVYSN